MFGMNLTKTQKIIISAVVIIVLLVVYIAFDRKSKAGDDLKNTNTEQVSTTTNTGITADGSGYTIEQVPVESNVPKPIPDLSRKVIFSNDPSLTSEVKGVINTKIASLETALKSNPSYLAAWIDLGLYHKMAGDYEGSKIYWQYATKLSPTNYVAFADLGNLYAYYLKDNAMAENYYKQAINKDTKQSYLYTQLAEVYKDVFKDMDKAKAVIEQGLNAIPNDPALLEFKANLK